MALAVGASPAHAQSSSASLRLVRASPHVSLQAYGRRVALDLGVYVAATGGDFELHVTRSSYEAPHAVTQVDRRTGATRPLSGTLTNGWRGLRRFFEVTVRARSGRVVLARRFPFCPNAYERQRVDDGGPMVSRYPPGCGSEFPFTRGMIWGIDEGWAVSALGGGEDEYPSAFVRIRPGRYLATVRIARPFVELFAVPPEAAEATVDVRVTRARRPRGEVVEGELAGSGGGGMGRRVGSRDGGAPPPTTASPDPSALPDLVALPGWGIRVTRSRKREFVSFAASPWNAGPAPMVVEGFRRADEGVMDAWQYFLDRGGNVVGRAPAGTMAYDARRGHDHWHFLQFARYSLLDASGREVTVSRKQAYCLANTDAVDLTAVDISTAFWELGLGTACGGPRSLWVREVLAAGWADTYYQEAAGQALEITGLPNGRYSLVVQVNPLGLLLERTTENNVATREIRITGRPGARRVIAAPWNGVTA